MKVIAAYLLAVLGGNSSPSAADLKQILGSVGAEADEAMIELLMEQVKGKDVVELIAAGREKMASVPAAGAIAVAAPVGGGGGSAESAAEAKKEDKKKEKEESEGEEEDFGLDLFS